VFGYSAQEQGETLRSVWRGFTSGLSGKSGTIVLPSGQVARVTVTM